MGVCNVTSRTLHLLGAAFHADDTAPRTNAPREKAETPLRATADLDDTRACRYARLIEQPVRIVGQLLGLARQSILLRLSIA
jgi:hypothetical protein